MRAEIFAIAIAITFLGLVIWAIRRKKLQEAQAVMWLLASLFVLFISLTLPLHLINTVSGWLGIAYAPNVFLVLSLVFLVLVLLRLSFVITGLVAKQRRLAQRIALLEEDLQRVKPEKPRLGEQSVGDA